MKKDRSAINYILLKDRVEWIQYFTLKLLVGILSDTSNIVTIVVAVQ